MIHWSDQMYAWLTRGELVPLLALLGLSVCAAILYCRFRCKRAALVCAAAIAALIVTGAFRGSGPALDRRVHHRVAVDGHVDGSEQYALSPSNRSPIAWWPETVETLDPVCHSSPREAAEAVARKIASFLRENFRDEVYSEIQVLRAQKHSPAAESIVGEVAQGLRRQLPSATIEHIVADAERGTGTCVAIQMIVEDRRPAKWTRNHNMSEDGSMQQTEQYAQTTGRVQAEIHCQERGAIHVSERFVDKPWLSGFAEFASTRPGTRWILGRSRDLASDPQLAMQQAALAAAKELAGDVRRRALRHAGQNYRWDQGADEAVFRSLMQGISSGQYVVDEFSQELATGRGGSVWRHAVLVQATPSDTTSLVHAAVQQSHRLRQRQISTVFSLFGLVAFSTVVYLFLNMATRGYYQEALLAAAAAVVVLGGAVVLFVS